MIRGEVISPASRRRFAAKIELDSATGCWLWTASKDRDGYGWFGCNGKTRHAHRFAYELFRGPVPEGMQLDHLCRVRACVNPDHLEPVTSRENTRRGTNQVATYMRSTHCVHGHPLDVESTYAYVTASGSRERRCRACRRVSQRRYLVGQKLARAP